MTLQRGWNNKSKLLIVSSHLLLLITWTVDIDIISKSSHVLYYFSFLQYFPCAGCFSRLKIYLGFVTRLRICPHGKCTRSFLKLYSLRKRTDVWCIWIHSLLRAQEEVPTHCATEEQNVLKLCWKLWCSLTRLEQLAKLYFNIPFIVSVVTIRKPSLLVISLMLMQSVVHLVKIAAQYWVLTLSLWMNIFLLIRCLTCPTWRHWVPGLPTDEVERKIHHGTKILCAGTLIAWSNSS